MNYYDKINWKNRSEGKTTKISAERLNHMDNQIFNNANAIGNVEKIADIGDGTLCGAAETLKETAEKLNQSLDRIQASSFGSAISLNLNTEYTAQSDGYVMVSIQYNSGSLTDQIIMVDVNSMRLITLVANTINTSSDSVFVRKGMKYKVSKGNKTTIPVVCNFIPISAN